MYNIRIGKERDGSISKYKAKKAPDFLFLYNVDEPTTEGLMMFKIHNAADTPYEFMKRSFSIIKWLSNFFYIIALLL